MRAVCVELKIFPLNLISAKNPSSIPSIVQTNSFQPQMVALQPMSSPNMTGGVTMVTQQQTIASGKGQGKQPQLLHKPVQLATHSQQQQQQQQQLQQQQQQQTRLLAPTATVTCGSQVRAQRGQCVYVVLWSTGRCHECATPFRADGRFGRHKQNSYFNTTT